MDRAATANKTKIAISTVLYESFLSSVDSATIDAFPLVDWVHLDSAPSRSTTGDRWRLAAAGLASVLSISDRRSW